MIETIRQGLQADGITVSISKLCKWFEVPRRTVYYRPVKAAPSLQERFVTPIKAMIEENPSFGYREHARPSAHRPAESASGGAPRRRRSKI